MNSESKPPKIKTLRRLLKLMLPYKKKVILASICVLLVIGAQFIKPYILKLVIDDFLTKQVAQRGIIFNNNYGNFIFYSGSP